VDHGESIALAERAKNELAAAVSGRHYPAFARLVHLLEHALEMWDGNAGARQALVDAKTAYARCALDKGDIELAASIVAEEPALSGLKPRIETARREAALRAKKSRRARYLAVLLVLSVSLLAAYLSYDYHQQSGRWKPVFHAVFDGPGAPMKELRFGAFNPVADGPACPVGETGMRMQECQIAWLRNVRVRGNVRLEARVRWTGPVNGVEMMINTRFMSPGQFHWTPPPVFRASSARGTGSPTASPGPTATCFRGPPGRGASHGLTSRTGVSGTSLLLRA